MALEIAKDKVKVNEIVNQKQEVITVDGDVIVNDVKPDVLRVISTTGTLSIYKKEALNGKIKLEGCVNTYIVYLADDEESSVRTINTCLDFAEIIDIENCKDEMTIDEKICIKGIETKILNGRKLHIKALLDANIKIYSNSEIEAIVDVKNEDEDIQMLNCKKDVMSLIGENIGKTTIKDTIELNEADDLAEIMKVNFSITDVETKISYNKVLIKANINLIIMYLTEDNVIKEVCSKIPLMGFIDMPNITDEAKCVSKVKLKNLIIRPNVDKEHSIYVEADIELFCCAYEKKEINMIEDLYSVVDNVDLKKNKVRTIEEKFIIRDITTIKQILTNPEFLYGTILGANVNPIIENTKIANNKIIYEGKLDNEIIVKSENNINSIDVEIPFEFELESEKINKNSDIETEISLISQNVQSTDDGILYECNLEICAIVQNNVELNFAQDIVETTPENDDTYSMVIYFVKPGDTLWKIAKKFKSRVEDIVRINGIEDENKIYVGQQLYIPKFSKSRIAI